MRQIALPASPSRIKGPAALTKSLSGLLRRVHRYGEHRAETPEEKAWSYRVHEAIRVALEEARRT